MTNKIALIRAEASLEIGTGHIMRCLVLADLLSKIGFECRFVSLQKTYELITKLEKFKRIEPQEFFEQPFLCDLLIFDNYEMDAVYENHFRKFAKKILVIDDLANRPHNCDILVDQNLGSKAEDYKNLVNDGCKILVGTSYCLLRPEFEQMRSEALQKRATTTKIKKILVNFGGSDVNNHSEKALVDLEKSSFLGEVEVVLGFNAPHFEKIQNFAKNSKNEITIHKQADMAKLILECDMAIAAGGTSAWERCCLGLPTHIIKIADNQEKIFNELGNKKTFEEFFLELSKNYQSHAARVAQYVDGKGAKRVLESLDLT